VEAVYSILILVITIGSIFLNVVLVNQRDYHKTCERIAKRDAQHWRGTAMLYQRQMHEAQDRHWEVLHELSGRV